MRTIGWLKDERPLVVMLRQERVKLGRRRGRGTIQPHNPKGVRRGGSEHFQMSLDFLMPFAFLNGIPPLTRRVFPTAKEGIPGIRQAGRIDAHLRPLEHRLVADIRTPMQSRAVKQCQLRRSHGLTLIRVRDIMAGQRARRRFFLRGQCARA